MRCLWKFQQCQEKFRLFCTEVYLSMSFILCLEQIENKQPVQTSFRCVLWRQQFDLAEAVVTFFWCQKTRNTRCMRCRAFFISRLKTSQAWFKQESKQRTGNKLRLCCFLRFAGVKVGTCVTDCVFEWKVFFVLLGFSPLLPTPGFSRCVA